MSQETEWFGGRSTEEAYERCYWRRVGFALFFALAAVLILVPMMGCTTTQAASKAAYDGPPMFMSDGKGNSIRLTKAPCPNVSGWLAMSSAEMVYQGKTYRACWTVIGEAVVIFDDAGDVTPIPARAFKPEVGV